MNNNHFKPTTVNEYFAWLEKTVRPETELYRAAHAYMESERSAFEEKSGENRPFLSVLTRTQGKRPDMLTETILCLTGQKNTNFELLLMGHNLSKEQHETLTKTVSELPEWLRERTRFIPVNGGTRTTPLNAGFEAARGEYVAILDDDDLVFDNWVDAFYRLHLENRGKILHTYGVYQDWQTVSDRMPNTPRAVHAPKQTFCRDFHFMDELSLNVCPPCTLAFPTYAFQQLGIHFDETMTTTEDWDYLMRCAFLTGVANSSEVTTVYRNWLNAENSATVHGKQEWANNYRRIVERFVSTPIVLPSGALHGIIDRNIEKDNDEDLNYGSQRLAETDMQVYYDDGELFTAEKMLTFAPQLADERFLYCFSAGPNDAALENVQRIRFDPQFLSFLTVSDMTIRVVDRNNRHVDYTIDDVTDNGYRFGNHLVFLREDPQIIVSLREPIALKQVLVSCRLTKNVDDAHINEIIRKEARDYRRSIPYRVWKKIKSLIKKCLRVLRFMQR